MKLLLLITIIFSISASFAHECKIPSRNAGDFSNLRLIIKSDQFSPQKRDGTELEAGKVLETIHLTRNKFKPETELYSYMLRSGIKAVDNFLYAKLYIIDQNAIGSSGLMVFFGGRGTVVARSYILGPVDVVLRCKI